MPEELRPEVIDGDLWFTDQYQASLKEFVESKTW
jgi:hypothetical protein